MLNFFKKRKLKGIPNSKSIAFGIPQVKEATELLEKENFNAVGALYKRLKNDEKSLLLDGLTSDNKTINLLYRWHSQRVEEWLPNLFAGVAYTHDAWEQRGSTHAEYVTDSQFRGFYEDLEQADIALSRARGLQANEAEIYARLIRVNLGLQEKEKAQNYFDTLISLDPHHLEGHLLMVNLLAPKWMGSFEEMKAFASQFEHPQKNDLRYLAFLRFVVQHFVDMFFENEYTAEKRFKQMYRSTIKKAYQQFDIPNISSLHRYYLHNYFSYIFYLLDERKLRNKEIDLVGNHLSLIPWGYAEVEGERDLKMIKFT